MANPKHVKILKQGVEVWNEWRNANWDVIPDLSGETLRNENFGSINLAQSLLKKINLRGVQISGADFIGSDLRGAKLENAYFQGCDLSEVDIRGSNLSGAEFHVVQLRDTNFSSAILEETFFHESNLIDANLNGVNLKKAGFRSTSLIGADLSGADLRGAKLWDVQLGQTKLIGAKFNNAALFLTDLREADLTEADLTGANLQASTLINTKVDGAKISGSWIYSVNVWDLIGEFEEQDNLVITPPGVPKITVDNIKIAQFIYLIMNNEEIRDVLNTLTSKAVLILGRFSIPERKGILDRLKNQLREYDLLPIVFDFDRPTDKDFTETIKTLAGLCYFVIADITNPKSSPLELQTTIPDYQIPFVPIIQEGEEPFSMMANLQSKYDWVLDTLEYESGDLLIEVLKDAVIDPAIKKHNQLQIIKAQKPNIRSASDFLKSDGA